MNLSRLEFFVLDEADKMLDLGFAEDLDLILEACAGVYILVYRSG